MAGEASRPRGRLVAGLLVLLALAAAGVAVALDSPADEESFPPGFFGVALAEAPSTPEFAQMRDGGVESVRFLMNWGGIEAQPGRFDWTVFDSVVAPAARKGIEVFPVIYATPAWLAADERVLPVHDRRQRAAWRRFLRGAVRRYGPGGAFWRENPGIPPVPVTAWQIWNEPNFFYFATPVSASDYAELVGISRAALSAADPAARLVLAGLFARPPRPGPRAVPGRDFLEDFYAEAEPGSFDAVALHPYSAQAEDLEPIIEETRSVLEANGDAGLGLWLTELAWGSGRGTAFEKGPRGQVRELRAAYELLGDRGPGWKVARSYWFSWKDGSGCDFCDSVGLVRKNGTPKPAWDAFQEFSER